MSNQKGLSIIFVLLGVIAVIGSAVGVYFIGKSQLPKSQTQNQSISQTPQPAPVISSSDETANWKTYTNTEIGFKVKYPIGWEYSEVREGDPLHLYFYPKHSSDLKPRDSNEALAPIELVILNDSNALQCLAEDQKACLDFKVDGVSAKKYSLKNFHEVVAFKNKNGNLFFELMSPKFDKNAFAPGSYKEYYNFYNISEAERKKIFDQILSTFRFF
ncbi:MAG: hypothetical protein UU73_C0001G0060 [Candidatus Daviesbacteria bacterium GW2011_GWA1_41_61]|uniref:Uncharacterized protein n=1 Tax=Candidatus Daviesbacteria bacterium GW2011_GWA2_40_9 TaxID=1618424 RepID=A0A0G0X5N0_9BACT|nr:MAG: hypothetical protein UU26_C0002G0043 [Candidatus Daviesbacteria bacterium GW2011_GWC1_40_9]KKR82952.1 MAG: hypothetical protein UU29_C0008G0061 [Candidatus Daviesbacteria bacterium GW2011_GWA2_40_9]KKR92879.1 MAG: hypothetical protein UU44_C0004G0061 [Candidatus Daviesbacteria bacterium GW2011_GWB1_41_15]KKS15423.1 MAG: hypothetical protein UU73_C0001G0060 [Candidatus Daviesbacteria bacterium GW2011_GWA1_41_61]